MVMQQQQQVQAPGMERGMSNTVLYCPDGHLMQGKVTRELWNKVSWWHYETNCDTCAARITSEDARYHCKECKYSVCMECSSKMLARNSVQSAFAPPTSDMRSTQQSMAKGPSGVLPGDIFLCGPDKWGIHHVVFCIGQMRPDPRAAQWIMAEMPEMPELAGMDIFSCETIESTRALKGKEIVWYVATAFFARNRQTGEAVIVADIDRGSNQMAIWAEPVKVKLLMHPLRPGHGGPAFNPQAFQKALEVSAEVSKHWSLKTAVKGIMSRNNKKNALDPDDYPTPESRLALLQDVERRWELRPICSSVAIMVWQRYCKLISGNGPQAADVAAQHILNWMPLLSDKTLPSALIKELSKCGWVMRGNLDA